MAAAPRRQNRAPLPAPLDLSVFRRMADMSHEAFYLTDYDGRFRYVNARALQLTGYTWEELQKMTVTDLDPDYPIALYRTSVDAMASAPLPLIEARSRRKDGSYFPVEVSFARVEVEGEVYVFGVVRDITGRKSMEAAQKTFTHRMLDTLETERQRVARELHDDIGQAIATVGVLLHSIERTPGSVPEDARPALAASETLLQQMTEAVARIVRDYHPAELTGLGLEETIRSHARQFAHRHRLSLRLATVSVAGLLSREQELHLYRIAQEALTNIGHHAHAKRVTVRLTRSRQHVAMMVRDDGVGFDRARIRDGGLGLVSMQQRAELMDAELRVRAAPGRGTELQIRVPLAARPPDRLARAGSGRRTTVPRTRSNQRRPVG